MSSGINCDFNKLTATDLSAMLLKESKMSPLADRDAGFYSGGSEVGDDMQSDRQNNSSPTGSSDDSVEIKMKPISSPRLKRNASDSHMKIAELDVPLKKRIKFDAMYTSNEWNKSSENSRDSSTFRPWAQGDVSDSSSLMSDVLVRHPAVTTLHRVSADVEDQPLELTLKSASNGTERRSSKKPTSDSRNVATKSIKTQRESKQMTSNEHRPSSQRNYKNMTRERRIEANARERTRVHTISAAFDTLRTAIPSYSNTQKLSKLSVLKVACAYILALSRMAGEDYSIDQSQPSISECLEEVSKTVQIDGKTRKRKDE